jgi:hypothetical protein
VRERGIALERTLEALKVQSFYRFLKIIKTPGRHIGYGGQIDCRGLLALSSGSRRRKAVAILVVPTARRL